MLIHFQQNFLKLNFRSFSTKRSGARNVSEYDISNLKPYEFDSMTKDGFEILLAQSEVREYLRKAKYEIPKLEGKQLSP